MEFQNLSDKVKKIIDNAESDKITVVDRKDLEPVVFNQRETIKRINAYINDKYLERDDGIFWNISNSRITHFAKLLGVDTKDFLPYADGVYNMFQSWALRKKARLWFKESDFYQTLNDLAEGQSTYGSIVWKKYKEKGKIELEECDLANLYFDQTAKCLEDVDLVEMHRLDEQQLWEKKYVWDSANVEKVLDVWGEKKDKYEIWEFWGYFMEDDEPVYKHTIGSGYGADEIILFTEDANKEKDFPYYDFHLGRYRGRWLRVGVVERLFKLQERINQLVNQNAQATEIASLLLLRSESPDSVGNVLEQAINGQIIPDGTLQQIGITNTGLQSFIQEVQMIEAQADRICLTPEIIQGGNSPSGTPFRSLAVVNSAAQSAFTAYKQNLGEKVASILVTDIFPLLVKDWNKGSIIELAEDDEDIEMYDKAMINWMKKEYLLSTGPITPEVEQQIVMEFENNIKEVGRKIELEKNFFDFKYGIKMMPTNETIDKTAMNDAMFNALQMTGANPAMTNIPLFKQYLENNGISWWKLTPKQIEQIQQSATGQTLPEPKQPDQLLAQANAV